MSKGGLGVMCAERVCEAAFIASVLETQHLRDAIIGESLPVPGFEDAMMSLGQKLPGKLEKAITTTSISLGRMQKLLHEATSVRLLTDADERGKARLHEVTQQYAGAWLSITPIRKLGLCFEPRAYRVCLRR